MSDGFDTEGYPPGSLGYERRRLRARIDELADPRLSARMDQLETHIAYKRDEGIARAVLSHDTALSAMDDIALHEAMAERRRQARETK